MRRREKADGVYSWVREHCYGLWWIEANEGIYAIWLYISRLVRLHSCCLYGFMLEGTLSIAHRED